MSCLFGDFNVYGSPFPNNIRLSRRITPTDTIVQIIVNRGEGLEAGGVTKLCYCSLSRDNTGESKSI